MTDQASDFEPLTVSFTGPLPSEMADLHSLQEDFKFAMNCCYAYVNLQKESMHKESQDVVLRALWVAAAIAYRRGFTSGKAPLVKQGGRLKIPERWYQSLPVDFQQAHDKILEIANKQVAHHVGVNEHYTVAALLAPPPMERAFLGTTLLKVSVTGFGDQLVRQMVALCKSLIEVVAKKAQASNSEFHELMGQQNVDDLYDNPGKIGQE
ncbi:hypothetical protein [Tsukamurella tyrosinosolvens]|uniref:hypothetical protein n=1 Tax=Tsukamurella tyrosinosolvens TaxID=57704 RepID=UPI000DF6E3F9|nr:hypothetical protein [Tsukamurella tyrosinosolvens]RDB49973.1 hypothetical protein DVB87_00135 [Tsukamurella tyrosinosolvens]